MDIFPYFNEISSTINEGEVFTLHDYCKNKFGKKCIQHYATIKEPGFSECPFGFINYSTKKSLSEGKIYISLVIKELLRKKLKMRGFIKNTFIEDELVRLIGVLEINERRFKTEIKTNSFESDMIRGIFHEIRRLSRDLDSSSTYFQKSVHNEDESNKALVDNILQTIKLISIRIDSYELLKNPSTITSGKQPNIPVYKKFDKCRYILNSKAKLKNVHINFANESYFTINGYDIFDILPYIILDNALKYSIKDTAINITFNDTDKKITIENTGPMLEVEENKKINQCQQGFRGKNSLNFQGSGLGLSLLKQICSLHNIKFNICSGKEELLNLDGIPYSIFKVELSF